MAVDKTPRFTGDVYARISTEHGDQGGDLRRQNPPLYGLSVDDTLGSDPDYATLPAGVGNATFAATPDSIVGSVNKEGSEHLDETGTGSDHFGSNSVATTEADKVISDNPAGVDTAFMDQSFAPAPEVVPEVVSEEEDVDVADGDDDDADGTGDDGAGDDGQTADLPTAEDLVAANDTEGLRAIAAAAGIETPTSWTKGKIAEAIVAQRDA